jgi:hypothetical protein
MRGWQARIEPVFLQRLPAQVLETYADRSQRIVSGIFGLEMINDLIFALKNALFGSSRNGNNHAKTGCLAVTIRRLLAQGTNAVQREEHKTNKRIRAQHMEHSSTFFVVSYSQRIALSRYVLAQREMEKRRSPLFKSSIALVKPTVHHDSPVNEFQVDLHSGVFVLLFSGRLTSSFPTLCLCR